MKKIEWLPLLWLAVAFLAAGVYFVSMLLGTDGRLSLPLDDAYIFFQYAKQLASGHPLEYNAAGGPSGGATSLLTVLVDAVGWLIGFRGDGLVIFTFILGTAGLFMTLVAAEKLARAAGAKHPFQGALFVLLCGPLLWGLFAGMDLPLFIGPLLLAVASWAEESRAGSSRRRTVLFGCIAAASRPEGLVFGTLLAAFLLLEREPEGSADRNRRFRPAYLLPVLAGLVPALILLVLTGRPSPTSLQVKGVLSLPGVDLGTWIGGALEYFASVVREIFLGMEGEKPSRLQANNASGVLFYMAPLTLLLFFAGILPGAAEEAEKRRTGPFNLTLVVLLAGLVSASLVVPRTWHWHRYLIPYYALILPFAAVGLERVLKFLVTAVPGTPAGKLERLGLLAWMVLAAPGALYFVIAFAQNSADIEFQQKALAAWARTNIPDGELIAVNDAGALRYLGENDILDLEGLVTPALTEPRRHGTSSLYEALERLPAGSRPGWLIVYPNWYDATFLKPHELVFQRRIMRQTIVGGNPMNVYRADWSGAGMGDLPASPAILGIVSGKTLRDRLDVADIADEREHRYRFRSTDGQYQGVLEMLSAEGGTAPFLDGGRVISREERFHPKNLSPGSDLVLVMRSRGGFRVRVQVDGQDAGEWLEPGSGGPNWTESALTVPGGMIRAPNPEIRLLTAEPHATAWPAFHYWFYQ